MLGGPGRVTQRRQDRYRVTPCGTVFFSRPTPLQRSRAVAQNLGQWISKTSWPGKFENVSAGHAFIGSRILASVALFASRDHCRTGLQSLTTESLVEFRMQKRKLKNLELRLRAETRAFRPENWN